MKIYLDYSASTPVAPEVREEMKPYFSEKYGNPSSLHSFGREAEIATDEARELLSRFFEVDFGEVYFTSGATEANNWCVNAAISHQPSASSKKPHIITSAFEHESVLEPIQHLEKQGTIEATYIKPSREGLINPNDVKKALKENTVLVSIIYVNNEIGTIQPIKEIGKIVERFRNMRHETRGVRQKTLNPTPYPLLPIFHADAVQAIQFLEPRLRYLKVDAMTVSAHKIYGPKGAGALIAKKHVPLVPLLRGGGQEFEKRSGTPNVPAIVGFGKAIELLQATRLRQGFGGQASYKLQAKRLEGLKKKLTRGILQAVPHAKIVGGEPSIPHIVSVIFPGIESQVMLIALDQEGIAVSSGAACSVKAITPSHVLLALGYSQKDALSAIRFSLGRYTSEEEIDKTIEVVRTIVKRFHKSITS